MNTSNPTMKQKTINISFGKDDEHLYEKIQRESSLSLVPRSTLIRYYIQNGMKLKESLPLAHV